VPAAASSIIPFKQLRLRGGCGAFTTPRRAVIL
jgi:hypothetical protein